MKHYKSNSIKVCIISLRSKSDFNVAKSYIKTDIH